MELETSVKVRQFFAAFKSRHYSKGEMIIFADGAIPPIFYIEEGHVGQYDISETGRKMIMTIFKPGAFFPMSVAVNGTSNKYFYEALDGVKLRQAPADKVVEFVRSEQDVMFDLLQRLYRGMDGLLGRMSLLMEGTAQNRLIYELAISAERFGERQPDGAYWLKVTEQQLADRSGLARETVSRELHKCARKGLVQLRNGAICIKL